MLTKNPDEAAPPTKGLTPNCERMLAAIRKHGTAIRRVGGNAFDRWEVGDLLFHELTGDALVNRCLIVADTRPHDGNGFDRFNLA